MKAAAKKKLINEFEKLYPTPESELVFKNSFQLLLSVLLSAQCTDKKVNQVTPILFKTYPSFSKLKDAKLKDVEKIIKEINYYKTKSKHLIATADRVMSHFGGRVPRNHKDLMSLPGVGNKTANVVLGELGVTPTFPVDTHVFRVSQRLGLAQGKTPEAIEEQMKEQFKPELWRSFHHWLILHGRKVCKAQRPLCGECEISKLCPSKLVE